MNPVRNLQKKKLAAHSGRIAHPDEVGIHYSCNVRRQRLTKLSPKSKTKLGLQGQISNGVNIKIVFSFLGLVFFFLFFNSVQAREPLDAVINEIAWMGTKISYNDEWIELYNNTNSPIELEGWILKAADGTPKINLTGSISANGFYLLERTDDNTVFDIKADLIYKGSLGNTGGSLELFDNFGNLIDKVDCSSGWFAGDNFTKQTMERESGVRLGSNPQNWQNSQNPGGTPKAKNSVVTEEEKSSPEKELTEVKSQQSPQWSFPLAEDGPPSTINYPSGIVFNEILPSPDGPDEKEEWIEIFNQNDFEVDVSGWQITDIEGKTTTYTFPEGPKISARGFLFLSRPTTKITLNNDGDGLNFIQPDGKIIDSVNYEKAPRGQSYNRTDSGWVWSKTLTPGAENIVPGPISEKKEGESLKEAQEITPEKGLAGIGEQIPKSLSIFLLALTIAIFSGTIILILKNKLKKL